VLVLVPGEKLWAWQIDAFVGEWAGLSTSFFISRSISVNF